MADDPVKPFRPATEAPTDRRGKPFPEDPPLAERVGAAKSPRRDDHHYATPKLNTRWVFGDPAYEAALEAYVARALDPAPGNMFLRSFLDVEARLAPEGASNALIQTVLKLTAPGVPDIYRPHTHPTLCFPIRAAA